MLWKHPRASLRRPRSTQRRLQRSQELPKASQDVDETTNDTLFEATGERGHKETRDHSQTRSQTKHASKPLGNEATQLMY